MERRLSCATTRLDPTPLDATAKGGNHDYRALGRALVTVITPVVWHLRAADRTLSSPSEPCSLRALPAMSTKGTARMCLAIPGQVIEFVDEANRLAKVEVAGVRRTVNVGLLDDDGDGAQPGDWVLIHVGFALSKVDEEEAQATLALLQGMGAEYEQELEELKASVIE